MHPWPTLTPPWWPSPKEAAKSRDPPKNIPPKYQSPPPPKSKRETEAPTHTSCGFCACHSAFTCDWGGPTHPTSCRAHDAPSTSGAGQSCGGPSTLWACVALRRALAGQWLRSVISPPASLGQQLPSVERQPPSGECQPPSVQRIPSSFEGGAAPRAHRVRTTATLGGPTPVPAQDAPAQTAHRTPETRSRKRRTCLSSVFLYGWQPIPEAST